MDQSDMVVLVLTARYFWLLAFSDSAKGDMVKPVYHFG